MCPLATMRGAGACSGAHNALAPPDRKTAIPPATQGEPSAAMERFVIELSVHICILGGTKPPVGQ